MTECSEFDDRKIYLSISLRCLIHHIHSNNHNCICIMQDIKHVSNTLIDRLLRSNSKSYVRENCIGISKWHHKIITTPPSGYCNSSEMPNLRSILLHVEPVWRQPDDLTGRGVNPPRAVHVVIVPALGRWLTVNNATVCGHVPVSPTAMGIPWIYTKLLHLQICLNLRKVLNKEIYPNLHKISMNIIPESILRSTWIYAKN